MPPMATWSRVAPLLLATATMHPASMTAAATRPTTRQHAAIDYQLAPRGYPDKITTERAYAKWIDDKLAELTRRAKDPRESSTRVQLLLSLANLRLARQAEPAVTRLILGDESTTTRKRLGDITAAALADIDQATTLLVQLAKSPPPNKAAAKQRSRCTQAAEQLTAFSKCLNSLARETDTANALASVAPLTKSKRPELASVARLFQAVLMRQGGQIDQALDLLPTALSPPKQLPHDFFARLVRCRLLADRGGHAIATTLTLQMDVQAENWFDKSRLPEARRAIGLLRIGLAERWAKQLQRDKLTEHATRRHKIAQGIRNDLFSGKDGTVYRLMLAVPILIEPPLPPPPPPPLPKSKPATTRAASQPPSTTRAARTRSATRPATRPIAEPPKRHRPTTTRRAPASAPATDRSSSRPKS